ncbi:MAG: NAD(P)/FAD-dependent oxidoreductase [Maribacter sp.]
MKKNYQVIIVGGGLAGLTASLHLRQQGHSVLLVEKKTYPHHKVCGEYVSNEVIPYLQSLGVSFEGLRPKVIDTLLLSSPEGKSVHAELPLGGIGISRFAFDDLLYKKAMDSGVDFFLGEVTAVEYNEDRFKVRTGTGEEFNSELVIGAYGKRNTLDKNLNRTFIHQKSSWLGVKAHYRYDEFPDNLVALHNFKGGYGGLSKTETGVVNFCYLASYKSFKKEKNIADFNTNIISENPFLKEFLNKAQPLFGQPLTIAQISFHSKSPVERHILMCGDTAGLIHPLCGNGMAMAIHSAKIASELICDYLKSQNRNRARLENEYRKLWNRTFQKRMRTGRKLQALLLNQKAASLGVGLAVRFPNVLNRIITLTHGKPI